MKTSAKVIARLSKPDWAYRGDMALRMALIGLTMALAFHYVDTGGLKYRGTIPGFTTIVDYSLGAFIGAGLAGFALAPLFGRDGAGGWGVALLGALLATVLGAVIAGLYAVPFDPGLSLITVFFILIIPPLLLIWLGLMAWLHHWARRRRGLAQS